MTTDDKLKELGFGKLLELPFSIRISFKKVIEYWEGKASNPASPDHEKARKILAVIGPEHVFRTKFSDLSILEEYREDLSLLMSHVFPEALTENEIKAISVPFVPMFFNPTKRLQKIMHKAGADHKFMLRDFDLNEVYKVAGSYFLEMGYGIKQRYKKPTFIDIPDLERGLTRHYRAFFNGEFSTFSLTDKSLELTDEDIRQLVEHFDDVELWKEKIPPRSILLEGFAIITLFDVTTDQALSELKDQLLQKDVLHAPESVGKLGMYVKNYLELGDVRLGVASYDRETQKIRSLGGGDLTSRILQNKKEAKSSECFSDSTFIDLFKKKGKLVIPNVEEAELGDQFVTTLLENEGVQSVILAPLVYGEDVLGFLELTSKRKNELNQITAERLDAILPLFTVAVDRALVEYETALEAIVQEKFTSIHSSVSWKFFEAAGKVLQSKRNGHLIEPEEIVFPDVVPIYGQFDIRGSSHARNKAIQADLLLQLRFAAEVVQTAIRIENLPVYQVLMHQINGFISALKDEINAGDEVKILDFLGKEVYPVFSHLEKLGGEFQQAVTNYNKELDPALRVVYRERKAYEETVMMINELISDYVETHQEFAQRMFPHYFEKYKTDGLEYNIYIGASLLQNREYHPVYLQNLRIWQLLISCGVERLIHEKRHGFPVDLKITSMILAHNNPLSIKFRMDEKQFDVDGAYNIRYEIIKKRIDKAFIKGTAERLTQPGKISIVYTQQEEAEEYHKYIDYLQAIGYLSHGVEELELEDLQGTSGLKAIRVPLNFEQADEHSIDELLQSVLVAE